MEPEDVASTVASVAGALTVGARARAAASIVVPDFNAKLELTENAVSFIDAAEVLLSLLDRQFATKEPYISWPVCTHEDIQRDVCAFLEVVSHEFNRASRYCLWSARELSHIGNSEIIYTFLQRISYLVLATVSRFCPELVPSRRDGGSDHYGFGDCLRDHDSRTREILDYKTKTRRGPIAMALDPAFVFTDSVMIKEQPTFAATFTGLLEYLWHRAARESSASALCALMAFEYDHFPFGFYADLLRQSADEARHASFYWQTASDSFDRALRLDDADNAVIEQVRKYRETGVGLGLPAEGVFYSLFWNTNLGERLYFMHIDTEAKGLAKFDDRISSRIVEQFPGLGRGLKMDRNDERFHARIGKKWLARILPDTTERKNYLKETANLRGFHILASVAEGQGKTISSVLRTGEFQ